MISLHYSSLTAAGIWNLDLFMMLQNVYGVEMKERKSLIIFDEVQRYPTAREMIKYLVADGRYDYIETGSLKRYTTKSLTKFKEAYGKRMGGAYIIHPKNLSIKDDVVCIPPYMTICL